MKKIALLLGFAAMIIGCSKPIQSIGLINEGDEDFHGVINVSTEFFGLQDADFSNIALYNEKGQKIAYQLAYYGQEKPVEIIFFADIPAGKTDLDYQLRTGSPKQAESRVFARFVPERKDDFAWENDRAAYRMYGPALKPENPSNGVDLWLKKTDELIVDLFYHNEHELGMPYHVDYGKGLDCYKVAHTAGCGGCFPVVNGIPAIGNQYDRWEVIENGPLRAVFRLEYDNYFADTIGEPVKESLTITCDAGSQLCRADVVFTGNVQFSEVGAGIFLHTATANDSIPVAGNTQMCLKSGYLAYAENAVSDAGLASGRNYVAIVMPGMKDYAIEDNTLYGKKNYQAGDTLTYYFGGGWSEWQYPTDEDWMAATARTARQLNEIFCSDPDSEVVWEGENE